MIRTIRCAVYTRKSSEEGLDQTFNSIDAQREACESYIQSQRHEGWKVLPTRYDDGGFSGGTLERPAVQRLLADMKADLVDMVVVYKIDRLTRSLSDFAKMVEIFDAQNASFVSVTQHFNTTTSMGRLTLNVLLSFAQFEREVTGERIRDKIAASKKKGMWMGGTVPIGYDALDRLLVVNPKEAGIVQSIYRLYLETGNVRTLKAKLEAEGLKSKQRSSKSGIQSGGLHFQAGALYKVLKNRVYLGEIPHKGTWYPGNHSAIVDPPLFQRVQETLEANSDSRRKGVQAKESSLLAGWPEDTHGNRLLPSHAVKAGKRYRYYVSRPQPSQDSGDDARAKISVPANDLESLAIGALANWLRSPAEVLRQLRAADLPGAEKQNLLRRCERFAEELSNAGAKHQRSMLLPIIRRIVIGAQEVQIELNRNATLRTMGVTQPGSLEEDHSDRSPPAFATKARLARHGLEMRLVVQEAWAKVEEPTSSASIVRTLAQAHGWLKDLMTGRAKSIADIAKSEGVSADYTTKVLRAALLAPDLVEGMLEGQRAGLTAKDLITQKPLRWDAQRACMV